MLQAFALSTVISVTTAHHPEMLKPFWHSFPFHEWSTGSWIEKPKAVTYSTP